MITGPRDFRKSARAFLLHTESLPEILDLPLDVRVQWRCAKAYMSHDIPTRARAIIAFLGVDTGYGARIKALACTFIGVGGVRPRD